MRRSLRTCADATAPRRTGMQSNPKATLYARLRRRDAMGFAHVVQQTLAKLTWPEALEEAQRARGVKGAWVAGPDGSSRR